MPTQNAAYDVVFRLQVADGSVQLPAAWLKPLPVSA